ncbi:hypothetical protein Rhopal_001312-T1 [Rhodotorula paludigena]|uniref:Uncharacterized protein n=1 Tax=Rhodotorula paludigena TaxID=86838 RepID=A0AAV5GG99_9BASI|nr:hypothetical protein Rhopal_001312-T1 [Rhodotorula paludigena]
MALGGVKKCLLPKRLDGCFAFVLVNGEHADIHDDWKFDHTVGWVIAQPGASFEVGWRDERRGHDVPNFGYELSLFADGELINREVVEPTDALFRRDKSDPCRTIIFRGQLDHKGDLVALRFANVDIIEPASDFAAPACFAGLQERQYEKGKQPAVTLNLVPGEPVNSQPEPWRSYDRYDEEDTPYALCVFNYETYSMLQDLGIIPRTPSTPRSRSSSIERMQSPDGTAKPSRAADREQKIRDLHAELQRLEAEHLSMMGAEKTLDAGSKCDEVSAQGPGSEWKNDDEFIVLERSAQGERKRDERTPTITLADSEDEDEGGDSSLA